MKAFLSPVPLKLGPSVGSRGLGSPLGAVPIHCCSATFPKQDVPLENCTRKVAFQDVTVNTIAVVVDHQLVRT